MEKIVRILDIKKEKKKLYMKKKWKLLFKSNSKKNKLLFTSLL